MDELIALLIAYYNEALDNINKNNITKAVELLKEAYKINSNNVDINNILGLCYFKMCNFNKAIFLWEKSLEIQSEKNKANEYLNFINSSEVQGNIEKYSIALELINIGEIDVALNKLLELSKLNEYGLIEIDMLISLIYLKKDDYEKALKFIKSTIRKDMGNEKANEYYRFIVESLAKSVTSNTKVSKEEIITKVTLTVLGVCILFAGVIFSYTKIKKAKANENVLVSEATLNQASGQARSDNQILQLEESLTEIQTIINSLTNGEGQVGTISLDEAGLLKSSLENYKDGNYSQVIESLKSVMESSTDQYLQSESLFWLGKSYEVSGEYDLAIGYYENYVNGFSTYNYYDDSLYILASLLYETGNVDKAKEYAQKLNTECSDSVYNNNKIKSILES